MKLICDNWKVLSVLWEYETVCKIINRADQGKIDLRDKSDLEIKLLFLNKFSSS